MTPGALRPADAAEVADGDEDLDDVDIVDIKCERMTWTGRRRLSSSKMSDLATGQRRAAAACVVDSVLQRVDVVALSAVGSGWWNVEVGQSRLGSVELYDSTLRNVHVVRCKLGYLNLRGATLTDVAFTDCVIEDLDLMRATATRVSFSGTRISRLELAGSKLEHVDLRGARLAGIGTLEGLRGATTTLGQQLDIAPALAEGFGIKVE